MAQVRPIPEPIIGPFPRKHRTTLTPLAKPAPATPEKSVKKETIKQAETLASPPPQPPPPATPPTPPTPPLSPPPQPEKVKERQQRQPRPKDEPIEVVNGKVPPPYKAIDPLIAMASVNAPALMVMIRQLRDMKGPMPDTRTGALEIMDQLQQRWKKGADITDLQDQIALHVTGQQERNELMNMLNDSHDWERATEIFKSRAKFEDFCHACLRRSDVNIAEGMALNAFMNGQLAEIMSRIRPKLTRSEGASTREPAELIQRANLPSQIQQKQLQRKFDEATPSDREILRKLGFKIETMLAARITKTTTETVEIVNKDVNKDGTP